MFVPRFGDIGGSWWQSGVMTEAQGDTDGDADLIKMLSITES